MSDALLPSVGPHGECKNYFPALAPTVCPSSLPNAHAQKKKPHESIALCEWLQILRSNWHSAIADDKM